MKSWAATAAVGLVVSLAVSAVVYYYTDSLFVFLFRGLGGDSSSASDPQIRECPRCGFQTTEAYEHCPHDGTQLE
jgi:hypothetical protein